MTLQEIRSRTHKKYKVGQVVNMRQRNTVTKEIIRRFKVEIVKFYPWHVSCIVNGYRESFTCQDMMMLTTVKG